MQFKTLKEALKDSLNTYGSAFNSIGKLATFVVSKIEKLDSVKNI